MPLREVLWPRPLTASLSGTKQRSPRHLQNLIHPVNRNCSNEGEVRLAAGSVRFQENVRPRLVFALLARESFRSKTVTERHCERLVRRKKSLTWDVGSSSVAAKCACAMAGEATCDMRVTGNTHLSFPRNSHLSRFAIYCGRLASGRALQCSGPTPKEPTSHVCYLATIAILGGDSNTYVQAYQAVSTKMIPAQDIPKAKIIPQPCSPKKQGR